MTGRIIEERINCLPAVALAKDGKIEVEVEVETETEVEVEIEGSGSYCYTYLNVSFIVLNLYLNLK